MTNRDLTIAGLLATGAMEVIPSPSRKYRTFRSAFSDHTLFFVGRSGALRWGDNVSNSFSMTDSRRHRAYREIGNPSIHWESADQAQAAFRRILEGRKD